MDNRNKHGRRHMNMAAFLQGIFEVTTRKPPEGFEPKIKKPKVQKDTPFFRRLLSKGKETDERVKRYNSSNRKTRQQIRAELREQSMIQISKAYPGEPRYRRRRMALNLARNTWKEHYGKV